MTEDIHGHIHTENCGCGHHDHEEHEHGECCGHGHDDGPEPGAVVTEVHLHDEARVISGRLTLVSDVERVRTALASGLERLAGAIAALGGIVGHIKASCEVRAIEMFSVTESAVSVKKASGQEIRINLAAIVFLVEPSAAERLVAAALGAVRDTAGNP